MPVAAVEDTDRVKMEVPEPVIELELKLAVTPVGMPVAVKPTAESKPSTTVDVIVELPLLPSNTETDAGEAESAKVGLVAVGASALIRPVPFGLPHPVTRS